MTTEAQWREWAIPVYRVLRDAGPAGIRLDELVDQSWSASRERVVDVVWWLRARGVAVEHRIVGPNDARYILVTQLPSSWDETTR